MYTVQCKISRIKMLFVQRLIQREHFQTIIFLKKLFQKTSLTALRSQNAQII